MDYILCGSLGAIVAFVFAIPAIVLEIKQKGEATDAPLIVDARKIFGRKLKKQEAFLVGLLIHIIFGFLFGLIYVLFVLQGWLFVTHAPYTFLSLIVYALLSWIILTNLKNCFHINWGGRATLRRGNLELITERGCELGGNIFSS